jgi:hypothetical protein
MYSGFRLNWGLLPAFAAATAGPGSPAVPPPRDLARLWQLAERSRGLRVQPVDRFELAGTLAGHPGRRRSEQARKDFPAVFALAVAGVGAPEPLRAESRAAAARALAGWARVYRPSGNPVDEYAFVPLLQAADLLLGSGPAPDGLDGADGWDRIPAWTKSKVRPCNRWSS